MDGRQVLDFYWTDPVDAMKRSVAKLQYKDKLYTSFKPGKSITVPTVRAFDAANSGIVFQGSYLVETEGSPLLALFYADASFSGASMSHHPIYHELFLIVREHPISCQSCTRYRVIQCSDVMHFGHDIGPLCIPISYTMSLVPSSSRAPGWCRLSGCCLLLVIAR